jgi:hypothetical protein
MECTAMSVGPVAGARRSGAERGAGCGKGTQNRRVDQSAARLLIQAGG